MAQLQLKPVQLSQVITRVLPTQKTIFAVGDIAVLQLPATILITSTETVVSAELTIETDGFVDKTFIAPLVGDFSVLYLGADIFGNKIRIRNSGLVGVFTIVAAK